MIKKFCLKIIFVCFILFSMLFLSQVSAQTLYWKVDGSGSYINTPNWSTTGVAPFTTPWVQGANIVFTADSAISNTDGISIGNLTVANDSEVAWSNVGDLSLGNTIRTFDIGAGSRLIWMGQRISPTAGTGFIKNGDGTWVIGQQANLFPGGVTLNAGAIVLGLGTNVLGSGTLTINGGALSANGYVLKYPSAISNIVVGGGFMLGGSPTVATQSDGSITLSSNVSLGSDATRRITVGGNITTGQTGVYTFNGIISGSNSSIVFDRLSSATGVVVLGGANTYNGGTNIQAGIVHLGASGVLPDTGTVTLSGGTLKTGLTTGFTETAGPLALTSDSTIALETGSHSLTFAASNGQSWTAGTKLTITGWTGLYNGLASATAGRLYIGSDASGITTAQLAQIQFTNPTTGLTHPAILLSTGEIVPSSVVILSTVCCFGNYTNNIMAYPNPFSDHIKLDVTTTGNSTIQIRVYDMIGKLIENSAVEVSEIETLMLGANYPLGVYNIVVSQDEHIQTVRVIKR